MHRVRSVLFVLFAVFGQLVGAAQIIELPRGKEFPLTIDYSRSVEGLIVAGKFKIGHPSITSVNFPETNGTGIWRTSVRVVCLEQRLGTDQISQGLKAHGQRPARLKELLMFAIAYPDEQHHHRIVALGSLMLDDRNGMDMYAPYLSEYGVWHMLDLYWVGYGGWGNDWCVLAVPANIP